VAIGHVEGYQEVATQLQAGLTLPASWYTDPKILDVEREALFHHTWHLAGHVSQLANPGDHITCTVGDIPLVVVRDRDGELRAFVNICRHRAHEIVQGSGSRKTFQCPYHGWTYNLDGSLRAAPRSEREACFDKASLGMLPAQVGTWGPLVFVNPDPEAVPSLAEVLDVLPELAISREIDLFAYDFHTRRTLDVRCNWKVWVEGMIECYHCPTVHPSYSEVFQTDPDVHRLEPYKYMCSQTSRVHGSDREDYFDFQFYWVWPTLGMSTRPEYYYITYFVEPLDPHTSRVTLDTYYHPSLGEEKVAEREKLLDDTMSEDVVVSESVQRGLRAGVVRNGQLLVDSEHLLQRFYELVHGAVASGAAGR
jgi:choline monooxygenase